MLNNNYHLPI